MKSKTLIVYIPGYKPNNNVSVSIKKIVSKLKYKFLEINYINKSNNNFLDINKTINEILIKIEKTLKSNKLNKIILIGYSLGAAIAVEIATIKLFDKLILISVFDDRKKLLKEKGIEITDQENISPIKKIKQINIPIIFIHGQKDSSIDIKRSKKTFKKANIQSKFFKIKTDHYFKQKIEKEILYNELLAQLQ